MPFFIHDVNHGIKSPIDLQKIGDRLARAEPLNKTAKSSSHLAQELDHLSERDLLKHTKQSFSATHQGESHAYSGDPTELVAENIMSTPVLFARVGDALQTMQVTMNEHEIHHLVIVDENNFAIGIVNALRIDAYLSLNPAQDETSHFPPDLLSPILSTTNNTPISHVAQAILQSGQDAILVSSANEIVGLITTKNFLRLFAQKASTSVEA